MEKAIILLVEDNEGDILLTQEAVEDLELDVTLAVVKDGESALHYVNQTGEYSNCSRPDLVLLDINIPKINGLEVVRKIKEDDSTRSIPVIMLTTSSSQKDIRKAYQNYANCYIVKPNHPDELINTIQIVENFWCKHSQLPGK